MSDKDKFEPGLSDNSPGNENNNENNDLPEGMDSIDTCLLYTSDAADE